MQTTLERMMTAMDPQHWKNILDGLDEDIVDSAAERFGGARYSDDSPETYPADDKPMVYVYPEKKRSRRHLWAGIGTGAAAAAVVAVAAGVSLINRQPQTGGMVPLSQGTAQKTSSTATSSTTLEIRDATELESTFTISTQIEAIPSGFSAAELTLFQEYFYGVWADGDITVTLDWSADSAFGDDYSCTGIELTDEGCYMGAHDGSKYDLWFVPADVPGSLYIYRNVRTDESGAVLRENGVISCENVDVFVSTGDLQEYSALGYFGRLKLADDMGKTPETLFSKTQLETYEGSDSGSEIWTRAESYAPVWDKVVLKSQTDSRISMSMAFTNSSGIIQYFDLGWATADDGSWYLYSVEKSMDVFARTADDLKVTLTLSDLDIFEGYYTGSWTSDSGDLTLTYTQDIFGAGTYCGGFYAGTDGWSMYSYTGESVQVYYISYDDPFTMFLYEPDRFGYASQEDYIAEYAHVDFGGSDSADESSLSWLGLQRWILDTGSTTDETSLPQAVYSAMTQCRNDLWSDETANGAAFEGYKISAVSDNKYRFTFQQFSADGGSRWVTMALSFEDNAWTVQPADGITDSVSG